MTEETKQQTSTQAKTTCPQLYLLDNGQVYCSEVDCQCSLKETISACQKKDPKAIEVVITPRIRLKAVESLLNKLRRIGYKSIALSFSTMVG